MAAKCLFGAADLLGSGIDPKHTHLKTQLVFNQLVLRNLTKWSDILILNVSVNVVQPQLDLRCYSHLKFYTQQCTS